MDFERIKEIKEKISNGKIKLEEYTLLDVIDKRYDENIVSNWLKFLFDPRINKMGNAPIEALLNVLGKDININEQNFIDINREIATDDQKRMDIVIEYSDLCIVIENKIRAKEEVILQGDSYTTQTKLYYDYIHEKYSDKKDIIGVFLKPEWNKTNHNDCFELCLYSDLLNEFDNIQNKSEYMEKFIEVGRKYYMGNEVKIDMEVVNLYNDSKAEWDRLETAYTNMNDKMYRKMNDEIRENFSEKRGFSIHETHGYVQIYKNKWNPRYQGIHYEILENFNKMLGNKLNIKVVLHMEGKTSEEVKSKLEKHNLIRGNKNVVTDNGKEISKIVSCTFNDDDENNTNNFKNIVNAIKELDEKYTKILDEVFS